MPVALKAIYRRLLVSCPTSFLTKYEAAKACFSRSVTISGRQLRFAGSQKLGPKALKQFVILNAQRSFRLIPKMLNVSRKRLLATV